MPGVCCVFCATTTSQQDCGVMLLLSIPSTVASQKLVYTSCAILFNLVNTFSYGCLCSNTMKDAVNCDKHSDLHNSVNQLDFEYGLCCKGFLCKHTCSIYLVLCTVLWLCWVHIKGVLSWYALQGPSLKVRDYSSAFRVGWVIVQCFVVQQVWCRWKDSLNLSI